jgi:hypothetical protein
MLVFSNSKDHPMDPLGLTFSQLARKFMKDGIIKTTKQEKNLSTDTTDSLAQQMVLA